MGSGGAAARKRRGLSPLPPTHQDLQLHLLAGQLLAVQPAADGDDARGHVDGEGDAGIWSTGTAGTAAASGEAHPASACTGVLPRVLGSPQGAAQSPLLPPTPCPSLAHW